MKKLEQIIGDALAESVAEESILVNSVVGNAVTVECNVTLKAPDGSRWIGTKFFKIRMNKEK